MHYISNYIYYAQHLSILLNNDNGLYFYNIFFFQIQIFALTYDSCCSFDNNFIFFFLILIIFIVCSLKDSQNVFIQSMPIHTCFFSILLNYDIANIKKYDEICPLISVMDEILGFFLHPLIFSINHLRSAKITNGALILRPLIMIKF